MVEHMLGEVDGVHALALQPTLHVGEGHHDGVDVPLVDPAPQVEQAEMPIVP
jgi:hypothetical protein